MNNDSLQKLNRQQLETSVIECHAAWERERELREKCEQDLENKRCLVQSYKRVNKGDTSKTVAAISLELQESCNEFLSSCRSNSVDSLQALINLMSTAISYWESAFPHADKQELEDAVNHVMVVLGVNDER